MVSLLELNPDDKCLVIAPHADDESIGCGGLLLKYPDNSLNRRGQRRRWG